MTKEIKKLINEKALISTLNHKEWVHLKRLKEIDKEIKELIKKQVVREFK